ncbi:hypothetical protein [Flavobacterium sp.]|jgi:hypothetical protein|uniref:hypothetical protein n=1 Tax=Flavobacterium sp. TaxID=239 RepID=UPI0037BEF96C
MLTVNKDQTPQLLENAFSTSFLFEERFFTVGNKECFTSLLCDIMKKLRDLRFYNTCDVLKRPLKVTSIALHRGNNFIAHCKIENTEDFFYLNTHYLALLK